MQNIDCGQNYGVSTQNDDILQKMMQSPHKMKKLRAKYIVQPENFEVTAQNDDIMQKMMHSPHRMKKMRSKY